MLSLTLALAMVPQGPGSSTAPVVINEFAYDDGSTDDREFVELYNRSGAPVDISGWSLVNRDATSPVYTPGGTGTDPTYLIPANTVLAPGAFYVIGAGIVPNVNLVAGVNNLFENDCESLELLDATGARIDSIVYESGRGLFGPFPTEGDGLFGEFTTADFGTGMVQSSVARMIDGYDNDDNGRDFAGVCVSTPGASNNVASVLPIHETFDGGVVGAVVPMFNFGFIAPKHVDPLLIDGNNYTSKPPSPQGGLAMVIQDNSGGGNAAQLISAPVSDVVVETYVYLESVMTPLLPNGSPTICTGISGGYIASDGETWALGIRGSTSGNGNPPDVGGYFATVNAGVGYRPQFATGIAWVHVRTTQTSALYLVDLNNGQRVGSPTPATDLTVLAGPINITLGVTDGWQRLRLHAQGDRLVANFGGTYGQDNGQRFAFTGVYSSPGPVWLSYREAMCANLMMRPPVFDAFDVHVPTTAMTFVGTASPTTVGTPAIDANGFAILGSTGFAVKGSGMVPFGAANAAFCARILGFGTVPGGYPIAGTPPTVNAYVIALDLAVGFADAGGNVSFPLPIPASPALAGLPLGTQLVDFDTALPFPIGVGTSAGMEVTIGQ